MNGKTDLHLRFLLLLFVLYLAVDMRTSNIDKVNRCDSILNTDFKSRINMILFKIYLATPFLTEVKTLFVYISSKTSLDLFKWYKIEDIKRILINAKYINEG